MFREDHCVRLFKSGVLSVIAGATKGIVMVWSHTQICVNQLEFVWKVIKLYTLQTQDVVLSN